MNHPNFNSAIKIVLEFFSELPPTAVAALCGIGICALLVFCGYMLSFVVAFFVFAISQSGTISLVSYIGCIAGFAIFGMIQGYKIYRGIKLNYEQQVSE